MTDYLTFEHVCALHEAITGETAMRDPGLVQSAVGRPQTTVFGQDAYSGIWEKAAALLHSLACNHGFLDGNKRTGWIAAMTFLELNGHPLDPLFDQLAAEEFVVAIADGRIVEVAAIASELVKFTA